MRERTAGFTLLEVLIALAILGGALVVIQLAASGAAFHRVRTEHETTALGLAQETLERSLVGPVPESETPFASPFGRYTREVQVADWEGKTDAQEVTVIIRWRGTSREESLLTHTLVANY